MSVNLLAPELEMFPDRYRWTVEECHRLAEEGRLVGRYELVDGEVIRKMGQKPAHANGLKCFMQVLSAIFGIDLVWVQSPLTLSDPLAVYSEPEPDISVTREPVTAYGGRHPGPEDVLLAVEVADTSVRTDLIVKSRLYARAGVPEYWVLDLNDRKLHIHRQPLDGEYSLVTVHAESETVATTARPEAGIAVADLLPPGEAA